VVLVNSIYLSDYTNGVVILPSTPASSEVKSDAISRWDSVGGQTLPELGDLVMPMDESWFFSQDFHFDEGLIQWQ
jgi:hypothetical protein